LNFNDIQLSVELHAHRTQNASQLTAAGTF